MNSMNSPFILRQLPTPAGEIPVVQPGWTLQDRLGALRVRWSLGRMRYRVTPGFYAVGNPDPASPVVVTANYKLSFDHVRRGLDGLDAWILVIDTKGVNVWCAAGKGTFSTKEVVRRLRIHYAAQLVTHRKIILPQLSATGVAAHEVKRMTGFAVVYGPVRADDLRSFIEAGFRATDAMRRIDFPLSERLKVIPVDIFYGKYYLVAVPAAFIILSGLGPGGYFIPRMVEDGWKAALNLYSGYLAGSFLAPALLPWIPFRRFSLKGLVTGLAVATGLAASGMLGSSVAEILSWTFMVTGLSSFMAMNFTGSSTFTSLSGVQKEMKTALPLQIGLVSTGLVLWLALKFLSI